MWIRFLLRRRRKGGIGPPLPSGINAFVLRRESAQSRQTVACALCHVVEKVCRITTRESPVRKVLRVEPQSGEQFVIAVIDAPVVFADMDQDFPQPALFVSFLCGYGKSPDY
ncbi:hypothetical protein [Paraburkholderia sp. BR13444]|uniref:hypothetical protein n=1 Tax=Paraburkholderia sp. BR13444 TaxID=3236997 RepID=UPI0034CF1D63